MSTPVLVQIIGAPIACKDGVKDSWREVASWAADQIRARFGEAVKVEYYDLFDTDCPSLPPSAQLPLVLVNGDMLSSGVKISIPVIRRRLELLGVNPHGIKDLARNRMPVILSTNDIRLLKMFKALGNPTRLAILKQLAECQPCVCGNIVSTLPLAQSTVSQHLKVLKEAGLIFSYEEGPATCYSIDNEGLAWLKQMILENM